jgi:hypothetical protein
VDVPVTVIVSVTLPAVISAALGVYVAVAVVPLVKVPVPDVVQAIVPLLEIPEVVKVDPEQILASAPALDIGVLLSLSIILTIPVPSRIDAFVGSDNVTSIVSRDSTFASSIIEKVMVLVSVFAVKFNVAVFDDVV